MPMQFTLPLIYSLYILVCALTYKFDLLPFPYTKVPLGLLIGSVFAASITFIICLPLRESKKTAKSSALLSALGVIATAFFMGYIPLNMDNYHITTNVSQISILSGMTVGTFFVAMFNYTRVKEHSSKPTEG